LSIGREIFFPRFEHFPDFDLIFHVFC
jgi:hypothetical protein